MEESVLFQSEDEITKIAKGRDNVLDNLVMHTFANPRGV